MRGILIHYNAQSEQGLIRAEDGNRYAFHGQDWRSEFEPLVNDQVDFEVDGNVAYDIFLLKADHAPASPGPNIDFSRQSNVAQGAQAPGGNSFAERLFGDWSFVFAAVVLLGCLLPYITVGGALKSRMESSSLVNVGNTIGQIIDVTNRMEKLGRGFLSSRNADRVARNERNVEILRWSLRIGYILYLVPIFALWLIVAKLRGKAARRLTVVQGLLSLVLPIGVPLLFSAAIYAQIPANARQFTQNLGGLFEVNFMGIGFWVMVLAGVAQLLARFALRNGPIDFFGGRHAA